VLSIQDSRRIVDGLDHPECIAVDGEVAYAGGEAGQIYRFSIDSPEVEVIAEVGGFVAGVTVVDSETLIICDAGTGRLARVGPGPNVTTLTAGVALTFPKFSAFDSLGNLYFTDSGDYYQPDGRLLVLRPSGEIEVLVDGLAYPNGLAVDESGTWLYLAQSQGHDLLRYDLAAAEWEHEVYVELPGIVPDGLALGQSGAIYVGCYVPDAILRVSPDREVGILVADPGGDMLNRPTNVAFAGTTLLFANLGGYHIGAIDVDEHGTALHRPQL
jgi:sugar lactone lactonase YvrE